MRGDMLGKRGLLTLIAHRKMIEQLSASYQEIRTKRSCGGSPKLDDVVDESTSSQVHDWPVYLLFIRSV